MPLDVDSGLPGVELRFVREAFSEVCLLYHLDSYEVMNMGNFTSLYIRIKNVQYHIALLGSFQKQQAFLLSSIVTIEILTVDQLGRLVLKSTGKGEFNLKNQYLAMKLVRKVQSA